MSSPEQAEDTAEGMNEDVVFEDGEANGDSGTAEFEIDKLMDSDQNDDGISAQNSERLGSSFLDDSFETWRKQKIYDVDEDGGGTWSDFFGDIDDNYRTSSDIEEESLNDTEIIRRFHQKCLRSLSPVSASIFRRTKDRGVATLPVKKAVCYGICSTDETESLTLLRCAKCSANMESFSYGHHMRFRHVGEIPPPNPQPNEEVPGENDCQDFLLSPLHVYNDPTTSNEDELKEELLPLAQSFEDSTQQTSSSSAPFGFKKATDMKVDTSYYVEQRHDLKIVVKRSPQKHFPGKPLSFVNSLTKSTESKRRRLGQKEKGDDMEHSKIDEEKYDEDDTDDEKDEKAVDKQSRMTDSPKKRKTTTVLAADSVLSSTSVDTHITLSLSEGADDASSTSADVDTDGTPRSGQSKVGARRGSGDVSCKPHDKVLSAMRPMIARVIPAGSAPASVCSSPSAAIFAVPQRPLSSSPLTSQLQANCPITRDMRPISNGHVQQPLYGRKKSVDLKVSFPVSTKLVPVSVASQGDNEESTVLYSRINMDTRDYGEFSNGSQDVDGMDLSVASTSVPQQQQQHQHYQPQRPQLYSHQATGNRQFYHVYGQQHHQQQHFANAAQGRNMIGGTTGKLPPQMLLRRQFFSNHNSPHQQQMHGNGQSMGENLGNGVVFFNDTHEKAGYSDVARNSINQHTRGGHTQNASDVAELRHQEQMMMRAAQVIGANASGITLLRGNNVQKRLYNSVSGNNDWNVMEMNGDSAISTNADKVFARPSINPLIKKFRPIMPRKSAAPNNAAIASAAMDQRYSAHHSPNVHLIPSRMRYGVTPTFGVFRAPVSISTSSTSSSPVMPVTSRSEYTGSGVRPIIPKNYPGKVPKFYPIAQKRQSNSAISVAAPNLTVRYGSTMSDDCGRSFTHAGINAINGTIADSPVEKSPASFAVTTNGRYGTRRMFATSDKAYSPLQLPYDYEKQRYSPVMTTASSPSLHQFFINSKNIAPENNLHLQNIEPPPVLEAEGRISTNTTTSDSLYLPPPGDDNLY